MSNGFVTSRAVDFALGLRLEEVPRGLRHSAARLLVDYLGATVAGTETDVGHALIQHVRGVTGPRSGMVVGDGAMVPITLAGLVNGTLSHALDIDDDEPWLLIGHPSSPVLSALVSLAHVARPSGSDFLAAFIVGVEVEIAFGAAVNPGHYQSGWHATSTIGALGATLACSRLRESSSDTTRHALGIAASSVAGLKRNFGTMTKPLAGP